jgi:hypothetical protein
LLDGGGTDGGTPDAEVADSGSAPEAECPALGAEAFEPYDAGPNAFDRGAEGLRALRDEAEASLALFEQGKAAEGDDYVYTVSYTSVFGGGCSTEIEVRDGIVVRRTQSLTLADGPNDVGETDTWTEEGDEVGTQRGCHPPRTFDELYAECLDHVLCQDPADNYLLLETFEDGLLSLCTFFAKNCADDCSQGPSLDSFEWL